MSTRLTRLQLAMLGLIVLATLAVGGVGLAALAAKDRLWADTFELTIRLPDAGDVAAGTPVRLRGVEAGHVIAVDYPESDAVAAPVNLRVRLDGKYRGRLFNDATARVQPVGLLGSKIIALTPGTPATGELASNSLTATPTADLGAAAEKLTKVADEAEALLKDVRGGRGTVGKLVTDDTLYRELTGLATDARAATGKMQIQAENVKVLVADGRDTLKSVKQGTDAIQKLPLVRNYVEDANAILVRPECRKQQHDYAAKDLFEPNTAILTADGRGHLVNLAGLVKSQQNEAGMAKRDIVVAAYADAADTTLTGAAAQELTRKQAEVVAEVLKEEKIHKTGLWYRNRPVTHIGMGTNPSPVTEAAGLPASRVTVVLFLPS